MESSEELAEGPWNLRIPESRLREIRESVRRADSVGWGALVGYGPACQCGLGDHYIAGNRGYSQHGIPTKHCYLHPEGRA